MTARRAGFTLIELLLAVAMVAMLTLSLYVGLSTAFNAKAVIAAQTDTLRQAKIALDLVEQDLKSILPPGGTFAGAFTGTAGGTGDTAAASIDCFCLGSDFLTAPDATHTEGMRHVTIGLTYDTGVAALTRTVLRDLLSASATPESEVLAHNLIGFNATYFDGQTWADSWDSTSLNNALPLAVQLTVTLKQPTPGDANHVYHLSRTVRLSAGLTADQAAAIAADAAAASGDGSQSQ